MQTDDSSSLSNVHPLPFEGSLQPVGDIFCSLSGSRLIGKAAESEHG